MSEKKNPVINELFDKKFPMMFLLATVFTSACAIYLHGYGGSLYRGTLLTVLQVWADVASIACLVVLVRCLLCKVRIDENGVDVNNPLTGRMDYRWDEVRTAAVVKLHIGTAKPSPVIILSNLQPEEVLTRKALIHGKGLSRHDQVRIMYTKARRDAVEHYLHMTLPDIDI